jgi:ketosteroid isomerase-like protein
MSQENVEVVRRALIAGFVSDPADADTLHELLDPECVMTSNWGADGTVYRGAEGALAARAEMDDIWDSWHEEIERVIDAGEEGVVGLMRFRARGHGSSVPVESPWAMVATVRDGRIIAARVFLTHDEALEAVGLEH